MPFCTAQTETCASKKKLALAFEGGVLAVYGVQMQVAVSSNLLGSTKKGGLPYVCRCCCWPGYGVRLDALFQ